MSWRDTVMTQTELYDKLDEVTARLDAAAEIIANSFESDRPVDTAEAATWLVEYEQAGEARVVENRYCLRRYEGKDTIRPACDCINGVCSNRLNDNYAGVVEKQDTITRYGIEQCRECGKPVDRQCTCHPDDNPPRPCPQKFALTECRKAAEKGGMK